MKNIIFKTVISFVFFGCKLNIWASDISSKEPIFEEKNISNKIQHQYAPFHILGELSEIEQIKSLGNESKNTTKVIQQNKEIAQAATSTGKYAPSLLGAEKEE